MPAPSSMWHLYNQKKPNGESKWQMVCRAGACSARLGQPFKLAVVIYFRQLASTSSRVVSLDGRCRKWREKESKKTSTQINYTCVILQS